VPRISVEGEGNQTSMVERAAWTPRGNPTANALRWPKLISKSAQA
jgi:hypothetical protein